MYALLPIEHTLKEYYSITWSVWLNVEGEPIEYRGVEANYFDESQLSELSLFNADIFTDSNSCAKFLNENIFIIEY